MRSTSRTDVIKNLKADILRLQGFKSVKNVSLDLGLGPIRDAFPNGTFPVGAVHEFLCAQIEDKASSSGFIAGVLSSLMGCHGTTIWISSSRTLFPPALLSYGLDPDRFIIIDLKNENDVIWTMEEALKCSAITAVVGEMREIDFKTSRRLQLAVEQSQVTGFILRNNYRFQNITACVSRWKIISLPSDTIAAGMPGIGFPKWRVELLRMRNGKSGIWNIQWIDGRFAYHKHLPPVSQEQRKAG